MVSRPIPSLDGRIGTKVLDLPASYKSSRAREFLVKPQEGRFSPFPLNLHKQGIKK